MPRRPLPFFKLTPLRKEKIWGYEDWLLSCHPHGLSTGLSTELSTGLNTGLTAGLSAEADSEARAKPLTLKEHLREHQGAAAAENFPLLVKKIHTTQFLSVQVHPSDQALLKQPAAQRADRRGKTECWYVLAAEADAALFLGLQQNLPPDQLATLLAAAEKQAEQQENFSLAQLETLFKKVKAQAGDFFFVPAGTVHAIGAGLTLLEVQQSSDTTYRLYDFGRGRPTQVTEALSVLDYRGTAGAKKIAPFTRFECPYFALEKLVLSPEKPAVRLSASAGEGAAAFEMYFVLEGAVRLATAEGPGVTLVKEEGCCLAVEEGAPPLTLSGAGAALKITPR